MVLCYCLYFHFTVIDFNRSDCFLDRPLMWVLDGRHTGSLFSLDLHLINYILFQLTCIMKPGMNVHWFKPYSSVSLARTGWVRLFSEMETCL